MKRGERSPEAVKEYRRRQRRIRRYMELREELQLSGDIPTEPDGATFSNRRPNGDERVDPANQTDQPLPNLIAQAVRNGWEVPAEKKPGLIDEMVAVIDNPEESNKVKVAAFNALRMADKDQYERDHPDEVKSKDAPTTLNVNIVNVDSQPARETLPDAAPLLNVFPQGDRGAAVLLPEVEVISSGRADGTE